MRRQQTIRFAADDRAIEGLPIRLVIALVVGVASLGIMMNMLSGIGAITETEVDIEADPATIDESDPDDLDITVIGEDGNTVEDATVVITGGTASIEGTPDGSTDADGVVEFTDLEPSLQQGQGTGTLEVEIIPPAESDYVDDRANNEIIVIED